MSDFAGCAQAGCTAACTNQGPCCISGACQFTTAPDCHPPIPVTDAAAATDTCAPSGCIGSCLSLATHNVSTMVDGCLVWQCCVPDDAGADAETDSGPLDAGGE
jgi:hypothetical protein